MSRASDFFKSGETPEYLEYKAEMDQLLEEIRNGN